MLTLKKGRIKKDLKRLLRIDNIITMGLIALLFLDYGPMQMTI